MTNQPRENLHGLKVLIAEDEAIVAMLLEDAVEQLGGTTAGIADTCDEALHLIKTVDIAVIVLDAHLHGATSEPVIEAADAKGIPVIISSGSEPRALPLAFRGRTMVSKPWTIEEVKSALLTSMI